MTYVFRPVIQPPKLSQYATLSAEAQKTLLALEKKYEGLINCLKTPAAQQHAPADYYKNIYQASFRKSLNSTYFEADKEESCTESNEESFIENPLQFTSGHSQNINNSSNVTIRHKETYKRDKMPEKKYLGKKSATEIVLDNRPSDEVITESILSLTQRTSHPDSPYMDFKDEFMELYPLSPKPLSDKDCSIGDGITNSGFPRPTDDLGVSESEPSHGKQGAYYDLLCKAASVVSPLSKNIEASDNTDIHLLVDGVVHQVQNQSLINWNPSDHNYKSGKHRDLFSATSTENMVLSDGSFFSSETAGNTNHIEALSVPESIGFDHFELKLSGCELSQISQSNFNEEITEGNLIELCSSNCPLKEDKSLNDKKQKTIRNILSVSESDENPFNEGNLQNDSSSSVMNNKCKEDQETVSAALKNSTSEISTCENESPYLIEADGIDHYKKLNSPKKTSRVMNCRNTFSESETQQRIDDFFQADSCRNRKRYKDNVQVQKRVSEQSDRPCAKKIKSSFKPPFKAQPEDSGQHLGASLHSSAGVINFLSLSLEEQKETLNLWGSSQSLALAFLYNTNQTSVTTFYTAADHAKKKNLALQPQPVGIVILETDTSGRCFLIPNDSVCRKDVKKSLLNLLFARKVTKIIANCKEFLIGLHKLFSLNNERGMQYLNLEDPVIACWLVDPDNQPSSFAHMCKTAKLQCNRYSEENWTACFQLTPKLMQAFRQKLKEDKLWLVFTQIEMKLIPIIACMEIHAIKVDTELFVKFSDVLKMKIKKLKEAIYKEAGHKFSLNSHVQLRQVLYEELELEKKLAPELKIVKTDVYNQKSTCESSLNILAVVHPLPALVLEYRQKLISTYVDGMMSCVKNGSLTTHWDQTAAATGRLTSSQPNIQAIPKTAITITDFQTTYVAGSQKTSSVDINVREPFISSSGCLFLAADFQQIELRVLAHLSGDRSLQTLFRNNHGQDIFISLTKQWRKKDTEEVTLAEREQTKRVVYSVMYGVGKDKLSEYLKVKPDIAQDFITSFLQQFPAIESFNKKCWMYAQEFGYTETVSGRRRYFPHINSDSLVLRAQARRQAVNFCVQGSAADICKLAMLAVEGIFKEHSHLSCRLLLQIHDELIWEVPVEQLLETKGLIQKVMEDTKAVCGPMFNLQVPLTVAMSSGRSWAHLNPFE